MNMNQQEIIEMEVVMREIGITKEAVKMTIRCWQNTLDELDRRAIEYEGIYKKMKEAEEKDKRGRDMKESNLKLNLRGKVFDTTKDVLEKGDSTFFLVLLASSFFELDANKEFFIDRNSHGFDRILDYMSTGELSTEGLNRYDEDCLYDNLKYFKIPHILKWDYSNISVIKDLKLEVSLQLKDGRLCGATAFKLVIFNMPRNRISMTFEGHTDYLYGVIQLEDGRLCSCSRDKTIKLWNIKSGRCGLTFYGHDSCVRVVLQLLDGRICSGSMDGTIRVWNRDSGECEQLLKKRRVFCV
jgi:WD40 repeat protein